MKTGIEINRKKSFLRAPNWLVFTLFSIFLFITACTRTQTPTITISPTIQKCVVPVLRGESETVGEETLREMGFQISKHQVYNDSIQKGLINSTNPPPGTEMEACEGEIIITVSLGPELDEKPWERWNIGMQPAISGDANVQLHQEDRTYRWEIIGDADSVFHYVLFNNPPIAGGYTFKVDAKRSGGEDGSAAGIIFNYIDSNNFYLFSVVDSGFYHLDRMNNGEWTNLVTPQETTYVHLGEFNRIKVIRDDSGFHFSINVRLVLEYPDLDPGTIGGYGELAIRV
ncbi:MAG: PASTA domain-containing protein, partial [Anaerolineaceae bacterium]|nr:PASTA domain-containing protein [Anaerolineaceae bacterium]